MSSRRPRRASESPKVYGPVRAYHWLAKPDELRDGEPTCVGKTHVLPGKQKPTLCFRGFHASASFEVSLSYAPGFYLTRVELTGTIYGTETDKYVASRRRSLWMLDVRPLLFEFAKPRLEAALESLKAIFPTLPPEFAQALVQLEEGYADGSLPRRNESAPDFILELWKLNITDANGETDTPARWRQSRRFIDALEYLCRVYGVSHTLSNLSYLEGDYDNSSYQTMVAEFEAFILSHAPKEPPMSPSRRRWTPEQGMRRRRTSKKSVALSLAPQVTTPALAQRIVRMASIYETRNTAWVDARDARDTQFFARQDLLAKLPSPSDAFPRYYGYTRHPAAVSAITPADVDAYLAKVKSAVKEVKKTLPKLNVAVDAANCELKAKEARVDVLKPRYTALSEQLQALPPKQRAALRADVLAQWNTSFPGQYSRLIQDVFR